MKRYLKSLLLSLVLFMGGCSAFANILKHFEVCTQRFAPQLLLEFSDTLYFEKSVYQDKMQLELVFPAMSLKNFKEMNVITEVNKLGNLIKNVELFFTKVPTPSVILRIDFAHNDVLIRWNKLENPSRLIIDMFRKSDLKNLQNTGKRLLQANNNSKHIKKMINLKPNLLNENLRILVDAGHGGRDSGANGFFLLKEKDVALDIARRTQNLLKKNGFNVFLTRNADETLSLKERSELAGQLKADLFVSIHVNAVPMVKKASGVESYFLNGNDFLPPVRSGGFLFVFGENDKRLANLADLTLKNNIGLSEELASNIHNSIVSFLENKNLPVIDRGVKRSTFRVLLRSEIPVALIEVGFLTNEKEAKRLSTPYYRHLLALGICNGIKKYVNSVKNISLS
ncbi:MAG: N-acetylmuramoyl-L-alanine amidase [bacterium]